MNYCAVRMYWQLYQFVTFFIIEWYKNYCIWTIIYFIIYSWEASYSLVFYSKVSWFLSDVKLSNILYKKGKIALCDWGEISSFSLSLGSACSSHSVGTLPTLAYRSPEMLLWKKDMNPTLWTVGIDIWSWGYDWW